MVHPLERLLAARGLTVESSDLRALAPALGLHRSDLYVIAGEPVPDDLTPADPAAFHRIGSLAWSLTYLPGCAAAAPDNRLLGDSVILYCHGVADDLSVLIRCQEDHDTAVRLHSRSFPDQYGIDFAVDARAGGLRARLDDVTVRVWDGAWLPGFIAHLAADYRGWDGERTWQTNHLAVRATFHTGGHVALTWDLRRWLTRADTWQASVTTWLEGGEQMTGLAADLREFLPLPAPSR